MRSIPAMASADCAWTTRSCSRRTDARTSFSTRSISRSSAAGCSSLRSVEEFADGIDRDIQRQRRPHLGRSPAQQGHGFHQLLPRRSRGYCGASLGFEVTAQLAEHLGVVKHEIRLPQGFMGVAHEHRAGVMHDELRAPAGLQHAENLAQRRIDLRVLERVVPAHCNECSGTERQPFGRHAGVEADPGEQRSAVANVANRIDLGEVGAVDLVVAASSAGCFLREECDDTVAGADVENLGSHPAGR